MSIQVDVRAVDEWFIGEDKPLIFTVVDGDGTAVDISGWGLAWALRRNAGDPPLILKTTVSGIQITDPSDGVLQVTVSRADSLPLSPARYWHALERTDSNNAAVLSYGYAQLRAK